MATQEQILHYAWKYQLYAEPEWTTTDGEQLRVITPGIHNTDDSEPPPITMRVANAISSR